MTSANATPQTPQPRGTHHREHNKWVYFVALGLLIVMAVIFLITFTQRKHSAEAVDKAQQLQTKLVAAGYTAPEQQVLVSIFGRDGGAVCDNPTGALTRALWLDNNMSNGATGPGMRPVIADHKALAAEALVISVYCPDHLQKFQDKLDDLKTGTTVRR
ncbi:hypothetical protein GCM10009839_23330 [Catenulispora yoronensis]|uniref:DUF732 domain-containing protein n=1 Tax=Catenulispora yoronensis TaxID=450799 RepID=A0ABN2U0A1_9ACTN